MTDPSLSPLVQRVKELDLEKVGEFIDFYGGIHVDECPEDDTCACSGKPMNDAINTAYRILQDLPADLEASQLETQELTKERDRLIDQVTLLSVRAVRTEATDQACLKFMRERDQARRETQELAKKIDEYGKTPFPAASEWIVRELHRISGELFCNGTLPMDEAKAMGRKVDRVIEALKHKQDADYQSYVEANRTLVESPEEIARFRNSAEKMQVFNVIRLLDSHESLRDALEEGRLETQEAREIARQARHGLPKELREKVESWPRETYTGEER